MFASDVALELVSPRGDKFQATPSKQGLSTALGILFKISNEHCHVFFFNRVLPRPPRTGYNLKEIFWLLV